MKFAYSESLSMIVVSMFQNSCMTKNAHAFSCCLIVLDFQLHVCNDLVWQLRPFFNREIIVDFGPFSVIFPIKSAVVMPKSWKIHKIENEALWDLLIQMRLVVFLSRVH